MPERQISHYGFCLLYREICATDVVIVIKVEHQSAVLESSVAVGVTQVQDVSRETSFKELTAGQRHGARAALTGFYGIWCKKKREKEKRCEICFSEIVVNIVGYICMHAVELTTQLVN